MKFEEEQRFTQWWLWALLVGILLIPIYGLYKQLILEEQFGDNPLPNYVLILLLFLVLVVMVFFWRLTLKTKIDSKRIRIIFYPFLRKDIKWDNIVEAKIVNYGFVGGWGVRIGTKYGTIYNTNGRIGLALELSDGRKICVGTQNEVELNEVVKEVSQHIVNRHM